LKLLELGRRNLSRKFKITVRRFQVRKKLIVYLFQRNVDPTPLR
jgi:hypothetical protein